MYRPIALLALAATCAHAPPSRDGAPPPAPARTYHTLTTGNGHGFAMVDEATRRVIAFQDHPYRFLSVPADLHDDGPERRNLLEDFSLGQVRAGGVEWLQTSKGTVGYASQSNVIEVEAGEAKADIYEPFGLEHDAMVAVMRGATTKRGAVRLAFHLGANPKSKDIWKTDLALVKIPGERIAALPGTPAAWVLTGHGLGAMIYVPLAGDPELTCHPASCDADDVTAELRMASDRGAFGVVVAYEEDPAKVQATADDIRRWIAARDASKIVDDSLAEWESWRKPPAFRFHDDDERRVWRQNEAILRMSQVREPNLHEPGRLRVNHGMILASIPPGHWATGWVRDGTYATVALARMGHWTEAKASLTFFLDAEPVGKFKSDVRNSDYRIPLTRYYGSGEEEADYSGQPYHNVEFDDWGLFLWAARQYVDASGDVAWLSEPTRRGTVYDVLRDGVARPIEQNLELPPMPRIMTPDSSIWETNSRPRQHYAFSTLMAVRGLYDFAALARKAGHAADADHYERLAGEVRAGFEKAFDTPIGLVGSIERSAETDLDGALVELFTLDVIGDPKGDLARRTLANLERLKLPSGGYKRCGGASSYQFNEWVFIDLRLATAFYKLGRAKEADALIARCVHQAAPNFDILPEEFNVVAADGPLGGFTGSIPMVGYGSGVFVLSLLDRAAYE